MFDRMNLASLGSSGQGIDFQMADATAHEYWLFSYGTLQQENVQQATFGRRLESQPDALCGFTLSMVAITDPDVIAASGSDSHPIIRETGRQSDEIAGAALAVTADELLAADTYEVSDYKRIGVTLKSGRPAFVYVSADQ